MASSSRLRTPSSSSERSTDPVTPKGTTPYNATANKDSSPTSTLSGSPQVFDFSNSRLGITNLAAYQSSNSLLPAPSQAPAIRIDPTISTSFDPSDKELYDLWAPK